MFYGSGTKKLLTPKETAEMLGVKVQTLAVWRSTKRYALLYRKIGSRVMYHIADIEAFIESNKHGSWHANLANAR